MEVRGVMRGGGGGNGKKRREGETRGRRSENDSYLDEEGSKSLKSAFAITTNIKFLVCENGGDVFVDDVVGGARFTDGRRDGRVDSFHGPRYTRSVSQGTKKRVVSCGWDE